MQIINERAVFATIPAGSILFEIYESTGLDDPGRFVGRLRTTSRFVASSFADLNLYFRHEARGLKKSPANFRFCISDEQVTATALAIKCSAVFK